MRLYNSLVIWSLILNLFGKIGIRLQILQFPSGHGIPRRCCWGTWLSYALLALCFDPQWVVAVIVLYFSRLSLCKHPGYSHTGIIADWHHRRGYSIECPKLEGIHGDGWVLLLAPHPKIKFYVWECCPDSPWTPSGLVPWLLPYSSNSCCSSTFLGCAVVCHRGQSHTWIMQTA